MITKTEIECAIARHWQNQPRQTNIAAIAARLGVEPWRVETVVEALDKLKEADERRKAAERFAAQHGLPRAEHNCPVHPEGSLACYDDCLCECVECRYAARTRIKGVTDGRGRTDPLLIAHAEYERLRKAGEPIPAEIRMLQHSYDQRRRQIRLEARAKLDAERRRQRNEQTVVAFPHIPTQRTTGPDDASHPPSTPTTLAGRARPGQPAIVSSQTRNTGSA